MCDPELRPMTLTLDCNLGFDSKYCLIYNVLLYYLPEKLAKRHIACTGTSSTSTSTSVVNYWLPGRETGSGIICSTWPELTTSRRLPAEPRVSELHRAVHRSTKYSISALNGSEAAKIGVRFIIFDICSSTRTILAWTRLSAFRRISPFYFADLSPAGGIYTVLDDLRYDTRCYFYAKSIAEREISLFTMSEHNKYIYKLDNGRLSARKE